MAQASLLNSAAVSLGPRGSRQHVQCLGSLCEQRAVMTLREPRSEVGCVVPSLECSVPRTNPECTLQNGLYFTGNEGCFFLRNKFNSRWLVNVRQVMPL